MTADLDLRWSFLYLLSVAAMDAPSPAEVDAGMNLTAYIVASDGWTDGSAECSVTLDTAPLMIDAAGLLPTMQEGFMLLFDSAGWSGMTFPVRVLKHRAGGDPDHTTVVFDTGSAVSMAQGHCVHLNVEPVASTGGEIVAHLCRTCDEQLPAELRL